MSLVEVVADPESRRRLSREAVDEAELAIREMGGMKGQMVKVGFDTVQRIRPGFLQKHVHALLPGWADAIEPHWQQGLSTGDAPAHLEANAHTVAEAMLEVSDGHAAKASDATARAVYERLRPRAGDRIADHMPRLAAFIDRNT